MSVQIELKDGQNGYDAVFDYVERYWINNGKDDVTLVSLCLSSDGIDWTSSNETVIVHPMGGYQFWSDWWEGQKFITLLGIRNVCALNTIYGGIYE